MTKQTSKTKTTRAKLLHSTNTHMSIIQGYVQLLDRKFVEGSKEKEWISKILKECENLQNVIEKIKKEK